MLKICLSRIWDTIQYVWKFIINFFCILRNWFSILQIKSILWLWILVSHSCEILNRYSALRLWVVEHPRWPCQPLPRRWNRTPRLGAVAGAARFAASMSMRRRDLGRVPPWPLGWLAVADNHQIEEDVLAAAVVAVCTAAVEGRGLWRGRNAAAAVYVGALPAFPMWIAVLLCEKGRKGCCPCNN